MTAGCLEVKPLDPRDADVATATERFLNQIPAYAFLLSALTRGEPFTRLVRALRIGLAAEMLWEERSYIDLHKVDGLDLLEAILNDISLAHGEPAP